ncbi:MAG: 1-phosphofructokinase family hexose kinase [Candidatus Magnetominusculus sp. LBB02]|nr:1-phosphofructokinase family hexose kinase [Candidatus Magnetominusculus sp. LBB02]
MIITVTLNPSIDKTLLLKGLRLNSIARADVLSVSAGGKGINVSRAVKRLGGGTLALTFLGGTAGREIAGLLNHENLAFQHTPIAGQCRTCLSLIDSLKNTETVINENGPVVTRDEIVAFKAMFTAAIGEKDVVAISGSAASGIESGIYYELIETAHKKGAYVVLDASGEALKEGLLALPDILKINKQELQRHAGVTLRGRGAVIEQMSRLAEGGIGRVIITDGAHQALALAGSDLWSVRPPHVNAISSLGSGDCASAAIALGIFRRMPFEEILAMAAAAGAQNTLSYGAGFIDRQGVNNLAALTAIKKIY